MVTDNSEIGGGPLAFESRRSPVLATRGMVATSQPLAAQAGLEVLQGGGNAADAAVAAAAALAVVEPTATGLGGDCFALFYEAATKQVHAVNGSGRAGAAVTIDALHGLGVEGAIPRTGVHAVTVPGAAAGWVDTVERHGRMPLAEVLAPAIRLAEEGHPVSPLIARYFALGVQRIREASPNGDEMLIDGRAPEPGEVRRNPNLGRVMRELAEGGEDAFYRGRVAEAIVEVVQSLGGLLTVDDLRAHCSTFEPPISTTYHGYRVYECAPNGQGLTALLALNIVEGCDLTSMPRRSTPYLHTLIEAVRLAFADTRWYLADPALVDVPVEALLSKAYAAERRALIDPSRATIDPERGSPVASSDTVYLSVVDGEGNACSFINSNYNGFGTGIVPRGCGFTLQNRGAGFSLDPLHPNVLAPGKRPYHTIIPAMVTHEDNGDLYACFGVMGGYNQPQAHMQVILNLVDHHHDVQAALDEPRFSIYSNPPSGDVFVEEGIPVEVMSELARMGHRIVPTSGFRRTGVFGRGQVIVRDRETGVLWGGSDPRADGAAIGY